MADFENVRYKKNQNLWNELSLGENRFRISMMTNNHIDSPRILESVEITNHK